MNFAKLGTHMQWQNRRKMGEFCMSTHGILITSAFLIATSQDLSDFMQIPGIGLIFLLKPGTIE
jgi:hypothetical protein